MPASGWIAVSVAVALVATGYLAELETIVTRLNVVRALRLNEEGHRGAAALLWLTEHRVTTLNVVLVLATVTRTAAVVGAVAIGLLMAGGPLGAVLGAVAAVVLLLLVGEVAPRTAALRRLESRALAVSRSSRAVVRLVAPIAGAVVTGGRALVRRRDEISGPYASDDELRALEGDDEEADAELEPEERAMIRSIFELGDTVVREIMQPRPDMVTVARDAPFDDVVETVIDHGYSRLPVHDPDDPDTIVGVINAKDLLRRLAAGQPITAWDDLVRRPIFVPETKRCDELLRELREGTAHLALVVDEYGELVGLVTIEDLLEEIVGEIVDEHDHEEPLVELLDEGRMRVDARLGVDDLNELLGAELPEEGWDTVGGLVFGTFGRVPVEGESIELDGTAITVEQLQGRRVSKVLVERAPSDPSEVGSNGA